MTEERTLRLECLRLAKGDTATAQVLLEWVTGDAATRERQAIDRLQEQLRQDRARPHWTRKSEGWNEV